MNLTERKVENLTVEAGKKDRLVFDDTQRGLAVRVTNGGGRSYLCQYTLHGQKYRVPLGACSGLSLSKAREAASVIMGEVAKGKNPAIERKEAIVTEKVKRARDRLTLRALITSWHENHLVHRRGSYAAEAVRALHHAFADYLDLPAEALDRAMIVRTLDDMKPRRKAKSDDKVKQNNTAIMSRTVAYGRAAYSWSVKRGSVPTNPFTNLPVTTGTGKRERVLSDIELAAIWQAAGDVSAPYGHIVRLLILTGQRRAEVSGMTWAEISDDLKQWTIPGSRTKNGVPQIVPLSEPARAIIRGLLPDNEKEAATELMKLRQGSALVFPGARDTAFSGWSKSKAGLDTAIAKAQAKIEKETGVSAVHVAPWHLHDLRRTLATGLQRLAVRLEVTEAVLNHIGGSRAGIVGVYQRHDWAKEKQSALESWAAHVLAIAENAAAPSNVTRAIFGKSA